MPNKHEPKTVGGRPWRKHFKPRPRVDPKKIIKRRRSRYKKRKLEEVFNPLCATKEGRPSPGGTLVSVADGEFWKVWQPNREKGGRRGRNLELLLGPGR